jgi:AcrR family transcriptional regulator
MWEQLVEARVRTSEPSAPSARLLRSGIDLFTRHGYAEVRVDDVCQAAGIAKGSFYRHFCSKEELFFAAAREVGEQIVERFTAYFPKAGPSGTEDRIEALVKALEPNLALVLDLTALAAQRRPGHARVANEVFERLHRATRAPVEAAPGGPMEEVLERALVVAIRRCVLLRFGPLTE